MEYFFEHIDELQRVGIVGLLFGAGNPGSTTATDSTSDGVTNGGVICTQDGSSMGPICNDHVSTLPDDDGGYLRLAAMRYFLMGAQPVDVVAEQRVLPPLPTCWFYGFMPHVGFLHSKIKHVMHGDDYRGMIYSFTNPVEGPAPFLCAGDVLEPDKILRISFQKLS